MNDQNFLHELLIKSLLLEKYVRRKPSFLETETILIKNIKIFVTGKNMLSTVTIIKPLTQHIDKGKKATKKRKSPWKSNVREANVLH